MATTGTVAEQDRPSLDKPKPTVVWSISEGASTGVAKQTLHQVGYRSLRYVAT